MKPRTRAAFFDLGGTLFDDIQIPKLHLPVLREAALRLGVDESMSFIGPRHVEATRKAIDAFLDWIYRAERSRGVDLSIASNVDDDHLDPMLDEIGVATP